VWDSAEGEFLVDLVGEDDEARGAFLGGAGDDGGDVAEFGLGVHGAAGVGGRVEDEDTGAFGDGVVELLGGDFEVVVGSGFEFDDAGAGEFGLRAVGDPGGRGDDDFGGRLGVVGGGVDERLEGEVEGLFAAGGDDDVVGSDAGELVVADEFVGDRLACGEIARDRCVPGEAFVDGGLGGGADGFWSGEVGLAGGEGEDIDAGGFEFFGALTDRERGRRFDARDTFREPETRSSVGHRGRVSERGVGLGGGSGGGLGGGLAGVGRRAVAGGSVCGVGGVGGGGCW